MLSHQNTLLSPQKEESKKKKGKGERERGSGGKGSMLFFCAALQVISNNF